MCSCTLDNVLKVDIDPKGVFKYILLKVYDQEKKQKEPTLTILRGYQRHNYHSDIYDEVREKLAPLGCEPIGGGKMSHEPGKQKIHIYGSSQGYGQADRQLTAKLMREAFPDYEVTIEGELDRY